MRVSVINRFWFYTKVTNKDTCWEWVGSKTIRGNYGQLNDRGKLLKAHRISYELHYGKIPKNKMICHKCGNSICVNPKHLYAGTPKENWEDTLKHNTRFVPNPKGEEVHCSKLKERDVLFIRGSNKKNIELAKMFGVSKSNIGNIKKGKTWKHLIKK